MRVTADTHTLWPESDQKAVNRGSEDPFLEKKNHLAPFCAVAGQDQKINIKL